MRIFKRLSALLAVAGALSVAAVAPTAAYANTDDYPAKWRDTPMDSVYDDWRELNRECTSFAAWRLHSRNGYDMPFHDSANRWADDARARGIAVTTIPAVGSIAWFPYGHVAWVESVSLSDLTVRVEEYNYDYLGHYNTRTIPMGGVWFIHFKDLPSPASQIASGAPAQPSDPNHDGLADVMVVPFGNTGSGNTEVHALDGTGFTSWIYNFVTAESGKAVRNGYHLFADANGDSIADLYEIAMDPNGSTDVHIKAGPSFVTSLGDWATPLKNLSVNNAKVALCDLNADGWQDLYVFVMDHNNGRIDVHMLDGRDFVTSRGDFVTAAGVAPIENDEIAVGDFNRDGTPDMYLVSLAGTNGRADLHIISGAGGFSTSLGDWQLPFASCTTSLTRVMLNDRDKDGRLDVYFMVYNDGQGFMDVLVLNGRNIQTWIGQWRTVAAASSFALADLALAA